MTGYIRMVRVAQTADESQRFCIEVFIPFSLIIKKTNFKLSLVILKANVILEFLDFKYKISILMAHLTT